MGESKNLAAQFPEIAGELEKRLMEKMRPLYNTMPKPERFAHLIPKIEEKLEVK